MSALVDELFRAAHAGDLAEVERLLAAGADPRATRRGKAVLDVVPHGRDEVLARLVEAGADGRHQGLVWAVLRHRLATVEALIAQGADLNLSTPMGTPIQVAAKLGELAIARRLLAAGADPDAGNSIGTPLTAAIEGGHDELAGALLDAGADPSLRARSGRAPLFLAAAHGRPATVRALLARGADPNVSGPGDIDLQFLAMPALVAAARGGHAEVVEQLLTAGAAPYARDAEGKAAIERATDDRVRAVLERAGAGEVVRRPSERLLLAAEAGDDADVREALLSGAEVDAVDDRAESLGWTPLMLAARNGHLAVVERLLAAGADLARVDARPDQDDAKLRRYLSLTELEPGRSGPRGVARRTALHRAAAAGHASIVRRLLAAGATPTADLLRATPLHLAAHAGAVDAAAALLDAGADPLAKGPEGLTPIELALRHRHLETAERLLDRALAKKPRRLPSGVLLDAAEAGAAAAVQRLLAAGMDPNAATKERGAALAIAAGAMESVSIAGGLGTTLAPAPPERVLPVLEVLLAAGADANGRGFLGTALYHAVFAGHEAVVRRLLEAGARVDDEAEGFARTTKRAKLLALLQAAKGRPSAAAPSPEPTGPAPKPRRPKGAPVPKLAAAARRKRFRAALVRLAEVTGTPAVALPERPGLFGLHVPVKRRAALDLEALQAELLPSGCFVFATEAPSGGPPERLVAVPTDDRLVAVRAMQTNGINAGVGTGDVVELLAGLEAEHPFVLTLIGPDELGGRFRSPPTRRAAEALAKTIYALCPDVVDQGTETVEALAESLAAGRLYLWWD